MSVDLGKSWDTAYEDFWSVFIKCFSSKTSFERAKSYVRGLMSAIERKNGWQLAEYSGDPDPYAIQNFLYRAKWSAGLMREKLAEAASQALLTKGEKGILIVDETGFLKKGNKSVGVKRQYSGTAGRTENCQIGVFLALAGSRGRALIDRELYLPVEWCEDVERRKAAGVPEEVVFKTKPQLAMEMLDRAFGKDLQPEWVLADAAYGNDGKFRCFLEERRQPYVAAVSKNHRIWVDYKEVKVEDAAKTLSGAEWTSVSIGQGAKGEREYDWAKIRLQYDAPENMAHYLLIRRKKGDNPELAFYRCFAPKRITLQKLALAAGKRWNIECCFEMAKQEVGLDEYEVRSWQGWRRHTMLSMVGLLLLSIFKGLGSQPGGEKKERMRAFKRARSEKDRKPAAISTFAID